MVGGRHVRRCVAPVLELFALIISTASSRVVTCPGRGVGAGRGGVLRAARTMCLKLQTDAISYLNTEIHSIS